MSQMQQVSLIAYKNFQEILLFLILDYSEEQYIYLALYKFLYIAHQYIHRPHYNRLYIEEYYLFHFQVIRQSFYLHKLQYMVYLK